MEKIKVEELYERGEEFLRLFRGRSITYRTSPLEKNRHIYSCLVTGLRIEGIERLFRLRRKVLPGEEAIGQKGPFYLIRK